MPSLATGGATARHEQEMTWLWCLGEFDDSNREFSLAPNLSSLYQEPGIHVVGFTEPSLSWPYILPGKLDTWAGPGSQSFEILFFLSEIAGKGNCMLVLDFLDTHSFKPPRLEIRINEMVYMHQTPAGNNDWRMSAEKGSGKEHKATFLIPSSELQKGENSIKITSTEGSWALWDALGFKVCEGVKAGRPEGRTIIRSVRQRQLLMRGEDTLLQPLDLEILHLGEAQTAVLNYVPAEKRASEELMGSRGITLLPGMNRAELWIPECDKSHELVIELRKGDSVLALTGAVADPVRRWEVHLIHQTHLDIGFTHTQEEVLKMQTGYLFQALDLIDETRHLPDEARFRWHPEGMWAIDEFFRIASEEDSIRFLNALKEQSIHLDAFYVHLLSGLASGEELFELVNPAKTFESKFGIPVRTAIGSDIPGYSWGLVTSLANQGIKFFNMAPNNNHKLGYLYEWADKPFYWYGPDGHSKVLTWMASHAYIYFWYPDKGMNRVPRFLDYLERTGFPYDIAMLRYEIGGDNGHPDPQLPYKVKAWNEKYAFPRIIISTNSRLYESFTEKYGDSIPAFSGDLTPYWEDGAASTASDLAVSREAGEKLLQTRALEAMVRPGMLDQDEIARAWNRIIMYDEHTWGAYCSKSDPYDPFTISQERYKQQFALEAQKFVRQLGEQLTGEIERSGSGIIDVFNTSSWKRSDLVILSPAQSGNGDRVVNDQGEVLSSQRLHSGELAFFAKEIPGFSSRRFFVEEGLPGKGSGIRIAREEISNEFLKVKIDPSTGSISSIQFGEREYELVDTSLHQLNEYLYVEGRVTGKGSHGVEGQVTISVEEAGPLVGVLRIDSSAPGCNWLTRRIRLVAGKPGMEIFNTLDKQRKLEPEGVYFAFPMLIPGGAARIDIPWGVVRPEHDQLPGANRNYYPVQRWMDISNENFGVTWVSADAPMVKFSPLVLIGKGRGDSEHMAEFDRMGIRPWWNESIDPGQSFYSWTMNNHWEVNYKAFQEGTANFRYYLAPHSGSYRGARAEKTAREYCQPLIALEVDTFSPLYALPFGISGRQLLVTSLSSGPDGEYYMVRLYNPAALSGSAEIVARNGQGLDIQCCDPGRYTSEKKRNLIELPGYGVMCLKITLDR